MSIDNKCKKQWEGSIGDKILDVCAKGLYGISAASLTTYIGYNTVIAFSDKMPINNLDNITLVLTLTAGYAGCNLYVLNNMLSMDDA